MSYDLIALGEVMLRLSPPKYQRLRHMSQLNVCVAGSQLNVAANMAQLGRKTAFLTQLPDHELGYLIRDTCQGYGVDMRHVKLITASRLGINYVEFSQAPRIGVAVYDRQGSAASTIGPHDFAWDNLLAGTSVAYTDGIFPGLSDNCHEATRCFLQSAKAQGCITVFDMNYREHLWTPESARTVWSRLLTYVDLVITNRSVEEQIFGFTGTDAELLAQHHAQFGNSVICLTKRHMEGVLRGSWESLALAQGELIPGRRFAFDVVDRFGTGDAFCAGFIVGYLEAGTAYGLDFGNALCALAHTLEGDIAHVSVAEVCQLLSNDHDFNIRR
jgi:2-dehydro-3-deoxygluconokinase